MPARRRSILLDSNLLLLLVIGSIDPAWISRYKRTSHYTTEQFGLLSAIVASSQSLVTTPHILTEVSNLANALPEDQRDEFAVQFRLIIAKFEERFVPAITLAKDKLFRFGIADTAMYHAANGVLILTSDGRFAKVANALGAEALDLETVSALE